MLRLLADENFNSDIVRGLLLRQPDLDVVRVQDENLAGADDPATAVACSKILAQCEGRANPGVDRDTYWDA